MVGCDWCILIPTVPAKSCSLSGPLMYHSPAVFLDHGHPLFRNFNSTIPVDVIRVKCYVDSFLDPTGVPVKVSINKLYLVPTRLMTCLVGGPETADVWVLASRISLSCSLILFCIHGFPCFPDVSRPCRTHRESCKPHHPPPPPTPFLSTPTRPAIFRFGTR